MFQNFFIQKIIALTLVFSFIFPNIVMASVAGGTGAAASTAGAASSGVAASAISVPVRDLLNFPLNTLNTGYSGNTSINSTQNWLKTWILDPMVSALGTAILSRVTESIVNWINNGFEGSPSFITDPASFFGNLADDLIGDFIFGTALGFLCSPFQLQIRLALGFNSSSSAYRPQCSLSKIINNVQSFSNNPVSISLTGNVTQTKTYYTNYQQLLSSMENPQNNVFGGYVIAQADLRTRLATQKQQQDQQLGWGRGFLSFQKCDAYETVSAASNRAQNAIEEGTVDISKFDSASKPRCIKQSITTPGAVIVDQLNFSLGSTQRKLELANSLNQIIGALMNVLVQKILTSAGGLIGASNGGSNSLTSQSSYSNTQAFSALQNQMNATYPTYQNQSQDIFNNAMSTTTSTTTSATTTYYSYSSTGTVATPTSTPTVRPITSELRDINMVGTTGDPLHGIIRYTVNKNEPLTTSSLTLLRKQSDGMLSPVSFSSVFSAFTLTSSDSYGGRTLNLVDVLDTASSYTSVGFLPNYNFTSGYMVDINVDLRTGHYVSRGDYVLRVDTEDSDGALLIETDLPFTVLY